MEKPVYSISLDLRPPILDRGSLYKRYIKSLKPKFLGWTTAIIFVYTILYFFWFKEMKWEIIPMASKIGEFSYPLFLSYLTAFIFYFLTIHYPNIKKREEYYEAVAQAVRNIIEFTRHMIITPLENCGYSVTQRFPSDEKTLKKNSKLKNGVFLSTGCYPSAEEWNEISSKPIKVDIEWSKNLIEVIRQTKYQLGKIDAVKDVFPELDSLVYKLKNSVLVGSEIYIIESIESGKPLKFNWTALRIFVETVEELDKFRVSNFKYKRPPKHK